MQRVLAAGAAAAAVTGAVLLRTWDRKAGKRVAELTRARARDEWRTEERIAELETDIEEAREIRAALDTKLRAKRAELARLRSEHAALLRRYANAETERASALEGRRLLAIETGQPGADGGLVPARREPATGGGRPVPDARKADGAAGSRPTATFAEADRALRELARNAARQCAAAQTAGRPDTGAQGQPEAAGQEKPEATGQGKPGAAAAQGVGGSALRPVPAAAAIAPARPTVPRTLGGFDFFGNATVPRNELPAPLEEDLADVVGDEAVAEQSARAKARTDARTEARTDARAVRTETEGSEDSGDSGDSAGSGSGDSEDSEHGGIDGREASGEETSGEAASGDDAAPGGVVADGETTHGAGEVIDLTAHDETEQLDLAELRSAIS